MIKIIQIQLIITILILCFIFNILFGTDFTTTKSKFNIIFASNRILFQQQNKSFTDGYNSTHLWSMRMADHNYYRLAKLLPCRTVEYEGGPKPSTIDSCDHSVENEYSIPNIVDAQQWLYEHQHPLDCTNKRTAIIHDFARSGFGSTIHQIAWALGMALAEDRIAVYQTPGNWNYGDCDLGTPDCLFLPISNCTFPSNVDGNQTIRIRANFGHWSEPVLPSIFRNRTFNWYRAQLVFYLMRFKPQTLVYAQNTVAKYFRPPSVDHHHPYISVYVRRSDKVSQKEMSHAYPLKQYFDLFDTDARKAHISRVYINSEDEQVFKEFAELNKQRGSYYQLLTINVTRNVVYGSLTSISKEERSRIILEFLTDLYIEANADLHVGTLTSNWCRLVDEIRLVLGKIIPYYTPENKLLMDS